MAPELKPTALKGEVTGELNRLLASREFANAERLARFLKYVVERTLAGDRDSLKESVIGIEVFDRAPDYDPKSEPIVRTEARRLRSRLDEYYQDPSRSSPIRILIPKGSYVAIFEPAAAAVAENAELAMQAVQQIDAPPSQEPGTPLLQSIRLWFGVVAVLLVAGGLAIGAFLFLRHRPPVLDHAAPFTTGHGSQFRPRFSPSGDLVSYDWQDVQDLHRGIYVKRVGSNTAERFTKQNGMQEMCAVWSPDGNQIAFLRDSGPDRFAIFTAPFVGVGEQKLAEFGRGATPWLDWSPNGAWLAFAAPSVSGHKSSIVLLPLKGGEKRILTTPPLGWHGDSLPVFSPDSSMIVFRRTEPLSGREDLYEIPVSGGTPKRLTFDNRGISSFAFTPDGSLVISSRRAGSIRALWWRSPDGNLRRLTSSVVDAGGPAVSRDGKHFAFSRIFYDVNIWRINADGSGAATPLIDSELADTSPQYSPDGLRLAFHSDRSGADEIWVADSGGSNATRLTDGGGSALGNPRWSPDGRQIAFEWHKTGRGAIYLVGSDGGPVRSLVEDNYLNSLPAWSQDGQFVYFASNRTGHPQIWKIPAVGGVPIPVTNLPGFSSAESRDGRYLVWSDPANYDVFRQLLLSGIGHGRPERLLTGRRDGDWGNWALGRNGIYYVQRRPATDDAEILYRDFTTGRSRSIYVMTKPPIWGGGGLAVSPDEKTMLFAQIDHDGENIFVQ